MKKQNILWIFPVITIFAFAVLTGCEKEDPVEVPTITDIDGNVYQTIKIGQQQWMAENLRVTKYNNGEPLFWVISDDIWRNATVGAYTIYPHTGGNVDNTDGIDSNQEMVEAYGKLYNWYAVDDPRGLCPEGWRVPNNEDWNRLVDCIETRGFSNRQDNPNGAGNALKSCRQVDSPLGGECSTNEHPRWREHDTHHGFDEFGFSALPGGFRWYNGDFRHLGSWGKWWSATESSDLRAYYRILYSYFGDVSRDNISDTKRSGFSIRCVQNIH